MKCTVNLGNIERFSTRWILLHKFKLYLREIFECGFYLKELVCLPNKCVLRNFSLTYRISTEPFFLITKCRKFRLNSYVGRIQDQKKTSSIGKHLIFSLGTLLMTLKWKIHIKGVARSPSCFGRWKCCPSIIAWIYNNDG